MRRRAVTAAFLLAVAGVVPAHAATQHTIVTLADLYLPSEVTIVAGDSLVLHNLDNDVHDVVARDNGPDGQPYFRSAVITFNRTSVVRGVPSLEPSDYPFTCSIHPDMTGVLLVR